MEQGRGAGSERMRRKALLADQTRIDLPVCDAARVFELVRERQVRTADWSVELSRIRSDGWMLAEAGLLRELCAATWAEIGHAIGTAEQGAIRAYRLHRRALDEVEEYGPSVSAIGAEVIACCYGARGSVGVGAAQADGGWRTA